MLTQCAGAGLDRLRGLAPLALLLVVALGLLGFFAIADEMVEGGTHAIDRVLLEALREPGQPHNPIGGPALEQAARDVTGLGSVVVLTFFTFAAAGYLLITRRWHDALLLLGAAGGGLLLSTGLKSFFDRPRPDVVPEAVAHLNASFPSGHAMLAAIIYLTLATLLGRVQERAAIRRYLMTLAIIVAVAIGLTRIYLGLHWPSDVLAGWCVGAAWACLCWILSDLVQGRPGGVRLAGPRGGSHNASKNR